MTILQINFYTTVAMVTLLQPRLCLPVVEVLHVHEIVNHLKFLRENPTTSISQLLTLSLLELNVVSLCHHYRAMPACTSVPGSILLTVHLKNDNGQFQQWEVDYSI